MSTPRSGQKVVQKKITGMQRDASPRMQRRNTQTRTARINENARGLKFDLKCNELYNGESGDTNKRRAETQEKGIRREKPRRYHT